jgi:hypothetical protein
MMPSMQVRQVCSPDRPGRVGLPQYWQQTSGSSQRKGSHASNAVADR